MRIGGLLLGVVVAGATSATARQLLLPRRWSEFQPGSQRFCPELRCRPLMTMALDVVAFLGLAMGDARAMNFAGLCCLVTESVIAGAPRTIRKGRRLSGMLDELRGGIQGGTAPTKMLIRLEGAHAYVSIFGGVEHLRDFAPQSFDTEVSNFAPSGRSGVGGTQSSQLPLLE